MSQQILQDIINNFKVDDFTSFFRAKNSEFSHPKKPLYCENNDFREGKKLEEIQFQDGSLIVCSFLVRKPLSERSGKKAQYELGKKILKENQIDAGIFIFYDKNGNFRFSLIYANYMGQHRDWSTFRRFTYLVSKDHTNKTFLQRIGGGDFSSLEKIKEAFSVEKVTEDFYKDIANWYFWAVQKYQFPKTAKADENGKNIAIIRLITRLIFIWFMRERGLVPNNLFQKEKINNYLKDLSPQKSTYYKAILQNLFFATLSTKQEERDFGSEKRSVKGWNKDYGNQYVYRYHELFNSPEKIKDYFGEIPFLNGGLFECLDDKRKGIIIDGFSRTKKNQPIVPNFLFFSDEKDVDLNIEYGTKKKKYKVRGLIDTLSYYNFTIDENDPNDAEIALDPELLGRVFEKLLASYNPETSTTARKATGSYYTPREIVNYMVIQSLKEYFKTHLKDIDGLEEKINQLFSAEDFQNPFTSTQSKEIVVLVNNLRIVDPAVGSGAFPMGILNKLVFILGKLDPKNKFWEEAQIEVAKMIPEPNIKNKTIKEIQDYFQTKKPDYWRKLYLIQKCIYGVDIQQIAVEIAKLRFFIALLVDEKIDKTQENWGVEPLPNLDFKIMQGNSLISEFMGIDLDNDNVGKNNKQMFSDYQEVSGLINEFQQKKNEFQNESDRDRKRDLNSEIQNLMIKIFEIRLKNRKAGYFNKLEVIEKDPFLAGLSKKARDEFIVKKRQTLFKKEGFDLDKFESQLREFSSKNKVKPFFAWKLYFAEVFQGDNPGFDIVIANPPYVEHKKLKGISSLFKSRFKTYSGTADLYVYFYEVALNVLREKGILTFISSNKFIRAKYGVNLRALLAENRIYNIVDFTKVKIFDALVASCIILVSKDNPSDNVVVTFTDDTFAGNVADFIQDNHIKVSSASLGSDIWQLEDSRKLKIKERIEFRSKKLGEIKRINIYRGITTGHNLAFIISEDVKNRLIKEDKKNIEIIKPLLQGRNIKKWFYNESNQFFLQTGFDKNIKSDFRHLYLHLSQYRKKLRKRDDQGKNWWNLRACKYYADFEKEKIVWGLTANKWAFAYDAKKHYLPSNGYILTSESGLSIKYLLSLLNSSLLKFYFGFIGIMTAGGALTLKHETISSLPIKEISENKQKPFIKIVDKILAITKSNDYLESKEKQKKVTEYERQIAKMVYKLYSLTKEEVKIVENSGKK